MAEISRLSIDSTNLFSDALGKGGITRDEILRLSPRLDGLRKRVKGWMKKKETAFLNLPFATDVDEIKGHGQDYAGSFSRTIVFGIGGSSLGGEMLVKVLGDRNPRNRVSFYDNVDPTTLQALNDVDWKDTLLLVVSKSGNTAETLSQFLTVLPTMERTLGTKDLRRHVLVITENKDGALYKLGKELDLPIIFHPAVGGRFSVLSVVGLLPAYIAGVDIDGVMEGARAMARRCAVDDIEENPGFFNGALHYLHAERGRSTTLMMPYCDNMRMIVDWFRQLWAESLGKVDADGKNRGLTPAGAHGVTDQHSQLQLYLDGPDDKLITFLADPAQRYQGERIPMRFGDIAAIAPLVGHTMGELFHSEFKATRTSLTNRGRPNRTFALGERDAFALGELIILLEMETVVVAELLGIDAFDQPAVEESKVLTRQYLSELQSAQASF